MANTIKQKRGTTDPAASDLVVGELAINTNDGGVFTKTDGGTVVELGASINLDTSPQLGGDLASNGHDIRVADDDRLKLGDNSDLEIFHRSSNNHSVIKETGSGNLNIVADNLVVRSETDENKALFNSDGAVKLYYDNVIRFETATDGIAVTGNIAIGDGRRLNIGDNADLIIFHNGTTNDSVIKENASGNLVLAGDNVVIRNTDLNENKAQFNTDGAVELYYDNVKRFETTSTGIDVTGTLNVSSTSTFQNHVSLGDDNTIKLGDSDDLEIYYNSTNLNSVIKENGSGSLVLAGNNVQIKNTNGTEFKAQFNTDAAVILFHNNIKKFETTSTGIDVTGHVEADTLNVSGGTTFQSNVSLGDDDELRFGANNDFKIVHDPNDCRFENSNGDIKFKNTGSYFFFDEDGGETLASFINDGAVNLFHNGSKKLETTSTGIDVTGHVEADTLNVSGTTTFQSNVDFSDSIRLRVGDGNDLQIYHDGADSYIEDTGTGSVVFKGSFFKFRDTSNNNIFQAGSDALYLLKPLSTFNGDDIDLDPDGSGVVVYKGNATKGAGQFKLNCEQNTHGIIVKGPPHSAAANYTLTLPSTDGSANQVLKTDGSGGLDWVDQPETISIYAKFFGTGSTNFNVATGAVRSWLNTTAAFSSGSWSATSSEITVPAAGLYMISVNLYFVQDTSANANSRSNPRVSISINGTAQTERTAHSYTRNNLGTQADPTTGNNHIETSANGTFYYQLSANDEVGVYSERLSTGGVLNVGSESAITIVKIA